MEYDYSNGEHRERVKRNKGCHICAGFTTVDKLVAAFEESFKVDRPGTSHISNTCEQCHGEIVSRHKQIYKKHNLSKWRVRWNKIKCFLKGCDDYFVSTDKEGKKHYSKLFADIPEGNTSIGVKCVRCISFMFIGSPQRMDTYTEEYDQDECCAGDTGE